MRVKSQHFLQPTVTAAHSVILEDNAGNIIFVAVEGDDHSIVTATAGDKDFAGLVKALGIDKTTIVREVKVKSVEEMSRLF
jgi:hypothetical protein